MKILDMIFDKKTALLFQGAGTPFRKHLIAFNDEHLSQLKYYCDIVKMETALDVESYIFLDQCPPGNENLIDQLATLTLNYTIFRIYLEYGIRPALLMGYSMGIYAALVAGGSISFKDGVHLVVNAYKTAYDSVSGLNGTMATIIGFDSAFLSQLITASGLSGDVEISNENNEHCYVVSGIAESVSRLLELANNEGALKTVMININIPFHSKFMTNGAENFLPYLETVHFKPLEFPLVSCTRQSILHTDVEEIKNEVYLNLKTNISWKKTVVKAGELGVENFIECGLGESLCKMSQMINFDYKFFEFEKITKKYGRLNSHGSRNI